MRGGGTRNLGSRRADAARGGVAKSLRGRSVNEDEEVGDGEEGSKVQETRTAQEGGNEEPERQGCRGRERRTQETILARIFDERRQSRKEQQ